MRKGLTLVELIVVMSLFVLFVGTFVSAFGQGLRSFKSVADQTEKLQIKNIVAEKMTNDIRSASAVLPASTSSEVFLQVDTGVISYCLNASKVRRKAGGSTAYLTNENEIKQLNFAYPGSGLIQVALDEAVFSVGKRN